MEPTGQTRAGRFFDAHPRLLRALALVALLWGVGYLTWRVGWSGQGASPVLFAMLLATEVYGFYALAILTWFSWSRPPAERPYATPGRSVDVYVCTYDEPVEVVMATLAGCRALAYPHTTYLLDDGRREEMREIAELAGAHYLTRADNSHAKAGNLNAALPRTEGDLVLMLDADHVPMPDALDAMVGYFDDERMALVQTPHDFFNHDSVQHYVVGRHEQSLFYRVVCPGKDRHGAAYWCGSAALVSRHALLAIGGVATETIAEDFHTTIRLQRHGWRSRYHDEVLVQGLAPHDLDGYLLQRDRWARGNLAVFTLPESPLRARTLSPLQRLSYLASLLAYLAPPVRLLLLLTLGAVMLTGELPMKVSVAALAALWLPAVALNLGAGAALARGFMRIPETAHYELLTMEIYTRALRCAFRPGKTAFKVTPKQGRDGGGWEAVRKLHLVLFCTVLLAVGTLLRLLDLAGVGPLPDMPGIAAAIVVALGPDRAAPPARDPARGRPAAPAAPRLPLRRGRRRRMLLAAGQDPGLDGRRQRLRPRPRRRRPARGRQPPRGAAAPRGRRRRAARGLGPGRGAQLPRARRQLAGRRHDRRHRPRLAPAADGVVLRGLQPRAPARPPPQRPDRRRRGDRDLARRLPRPRARAGAVPLLEQA